ncbi:MAG: trypsin-like peptidase domain-containing protein [Candidatus Hydrogenedentes bacterium]|nr:trypsin-like peptidase domain-containing protein [Candidatus Hydrogenedentota bacterium]
MRARRIPPSLIALVLALSCAPPAPTAEEASPPDSVDASRRNAIVRAIERAAPAVVSINVVEIRTRREFPATFRDFWDFFDMPRPQYRLEKRRLDSVGSGFVFDDRGHVLTNYHVIEGADQVDSITLGDGRQFPVEVVGVDERNDLAVLRIQGDAAVPRCAIGHSNDLMPGEWSIAIGNPFGVLMGDAQPTVSVGVISANHRRVSRSVGGGERLYQDMIQTDAAINPGNSGGPLVNAHGEVIGVNTMIFSSSGGSIGLGFAIPIDRARRVAEEIIEYGRRRDPWAGFKVEDVQGLRADFRQELGIRAETGCLVINILKSAPAYTSGLRPGDVVTAINGQPVHTSSDIDFVIWGQFVGDRVALSVDRKGQALAIEFPVEELDSSAAR